MGHAGCTKITTHSNMVSSLSFLLLVTVCSSLPFPRPDSPPNAAGDYNFRFQNSGQLDRQSRQESGFGSESDGSESEVVEGSYSFITPEGQEVAVSYTADENGYFPKGDSIHPALARALEHLRRQNSL